MSGCGVHRTEGKNFWLFFARTVPVTTLGCWRAVDDFGTVLDVLLQDRRDTQAAKTFLEKLLLNHDVPDVIHTDSLWGYRAAIRELSVFGSLNPV